MKDPLVFNIQRFSVHDGPGIRTTVFLKGCSLRCRWCHNPEGMEPGPQIQYFPENCAGCGACAAVCPRGVYVKEGERRGGERCVLCGACAEACLFDALKLAGRRMSPEEVMAQAEKDKLYYDNSGGGLTLSGGEPLLFPEFCARLFALARERGIHTALDTACNVPWEHVEAVLPYTGAVLLDLKAMNGDLHRACTGFSNKQILENAEKLFEADVDLYIRIPVIAGLNDTEENALAAAAFLRDAPNVREVTLLPYHSFGAEKAKSLGLKQEEFSAPAGEKIARLDSYFKAVEFMERRLAS